MVARGRIKDRPTPGRYTVWCRAERTAPVRTNTWTYRLDAEANALDCFEHGHPTSAGGRYKTVEVRDEFNQMTIWRQERHGKNYG